MKITIEMIEQIFSEYNAKAFDGILPKPKFEIITVKSKLGDFSGSIVMNNFRIRVSNYYDRSYDGFRNTIVHEMIHYYIRFNRIKDSSMHGYRFKGFANSLNSKFPELHIKTRSDVEGEVSNEVIIRKAIRSSKSSETIFLVIGTNGKYAAGVCKNEKLKTIEPIFKRWSFVKKYKIIKNVPIEHTIGLAHMRTRGHLEYISKEKYNLLLSFDRG